MAFPDYYKPDVPEFSLYQTPQAFFNEPEKDFLQSVSDWRNERNAARKEDEYEEALKYKEEMKQAMQQQPGAAPMTTEQMLAQAQPIMAEYGKIAELLEIEKLKDQQGRQKVLDDARIISVAKTIRNSSPDDTMKNEYLKAIGREDLMPYALEDPGRIMSQGGDLIRARHDGSYEVLRTKPERVTAHKLESWANPTTGDIRDVDPYNAPAMEAARAEGFERPKNADMTTVLTDFLVNRGITGMPTTRAAPPSQEAQRNEKEFEELYINKTRQPATSKQTVGILRRKPSYLDKAKEAARRAKAKGE